MKKANSIIDEVVFYLLAAALVALVGIFFVQVVARYVFGASFSSAEEVSILLMVWATWGGASLAVKQGAHLRILLVAERLTDRSSLRLKPRYLELWGQKLGGFPWREN